MTVNLVLDIETKIDRLALAASGRTSAPRDMPPPLQVITAISMLEFDCDENGRVSGFVLTSRDAQDGGEAALVEIAERRLAGLHAKGGELITYNGRHDLSVMRFALIRARTLGGGGVTSWMNEPPERHRDLMHEVAGCGRWSRLDDVAAGLGFAGPVILMSAAEPEACRAKSERDVVLTALFYIHLQAERSGDGEGFKRNLLTIGRFLGARALSMPHLGSVLLSPIFATDARRLKGAAGIRNLGRSRMSS